MKRLVLLALACSIFSACGSDVADSLSSSSSLSSLSDSFSLSDIRAPAAGKINLIFENLESSDLTGAFFSSTGSSADFIDLLPKAQSFPGKHFVVFDQAPATYSFNYKFANGVFSPIKTQALTTAGKNVSMGANQANTGSVDVSTPVSSTSSSSSSSSTSTSSASGYTCSKYAGAMGKCTFVNTCASNTANGSGYYQTNLGTYSFSNSSGIEAAATAYVNACLN